MKTDQKAFTLIEVMVTVFVVSFCLLAILRLINSSRVSLSQSTLQLNAQASADELLQRIKMMRWDNNSIPGTMIDKNIATVSPPSSIPNPKTAIEHWSGYTDTDNSRAPFGPFKRRVEVSFVRINSKKQVSISSQNQDRKQVTVWAYGPTGSNSTGTVSAIFLNRP